MKEKDKIIGDLALRFNLSDETIDNYSLSYLNYLKMEGKLKDQIIDNLIELQKNDNSNPIIDNLKNLI